MRHRWSLNRNRMIRPGCLLVAAAFLCHGQDHTTWRDYAGGSRFRRSVLRYAQRRSTAPT